jgi:predicted ATPase
MGIQKLNIQGFRSLRDVAWEPGKLNLVIGPNGSGKSNLLRGLMLLQKGAQGELPEEILRAGGISPLLWDGQVQELSWSVQTDPLDRKRDLVREALTYQLCLRQLGAGSSYRVERELLANYYLKNMGQAAEPKKFLERTPHHAVTFDVQERKLAAHEGSIPDDQTLLSLVAGPFGNPVLAGFRDNLASWSIYHDIHVDQGAKLRQAAVARMDRRVAADGQNLIPVLHTLYTGDREFKRSIDDAMRVAFSGDYEELVFPPAADQRVQLRVRWRSLRTEQSAADLSDGTIRFLLLIAILSVFSRLVAAPAAGDRRAPRLDSACDRCRSWRARRCSRGRTRSSSRRPRAARPRRRSSRRSRCCWTTRPRASGRCTSRRSRPCSTTRPSASGSTPRWSACAASCGTATPPATSGAAFLREPAELLMTTPESLEVMLVSEKIDTRKLFGDLRIVIIDEIHALAGTDRGAHLLSVLERIAGSPPRRPARRPERDRRQPAAILKWLQGTSKRRRRSSIRPSSRPAPAARRPPARARRPRRDAAKVAQGGKSLFFCQSRSVTEAVAEHMRRAGTTVFVHHSAVSLEERALAEERFHHGTDACIVCTSTLELGIDVGDLDRVLQPRRPTP